MRYFSRSFYLAAGLAVVLCACNGTHEDRQIEFSPDGKSVGFQHGRDGIYVRDAERGRVELVYQPPGEVIAASTPLWSPDGDRLVFATATPEDPKLAQQAKEAAKNSQDEWAANPEGRYVGEAPAVYECWLSERGKDRALGPPRKLFEAKVNHVGLIAANLAVRWHPAGNGLLYLDRAQGKTHQVREFNFKVSSTRRAVPFLAECLLFDWSPDGKRLALVVHAKQPENNGIWIGSLEKNDWWRVPSSKVAFEGEAQNLLNSARKLRPVWSRDGRRFAFVAPILPDGQVNDSIDVLYVGEPGAKLVRELYRTQGTLHELHWSPEGDRLGYLIRSKTLDQLRGTLFHDGLSDLLMTQRLGETEPVPVSLRPVRHFAGWNRTGTRLAYTLPTPTGPHAELQWAFLLPPRAGARDRVVVADSARPDSEREVFSGMRASFLNWSPQSDRLSLWATFAPSHALLPFGLAGGAGLRPGDPAILLDANTGQVDWMPINAGEKVQIGHYYLLRKNYAEARRWYDEAAADFAAQQPDENRSQAADFWNPRRFEFFHFYCLEQLGEHQAASKKLREFFTLTNYQPPPAKQANGGPPIGPEISADAHALLRQLYVAQVFLSLDAPEAGLVFFEQRPADYAELLPPESLEPERFAALLARAQLLLNAERFDAFAKLATDEMLPRLLKQDLPSLDDRSIEQISTASPGIAAAGFCLLPLMAGEFVNSLSEDTLNEILPAWTAFRDQTQSQVVRLWIDRFVFLASERTGQQAQAGAARNRYEMNLQKPKFDFETMFNSELFDFRRQLQVWDAMLNAVRTGTR